MRAVGSHVREDDGNYFVHDLEVKNSQHWVVAAEGVDKLHSGVERGVEELGEAL